MIAIPELRRSPSGRGATRSPVSPRFGRRVTRIARVRSVVRRVRRGELSPSSFGLSDRQSWCFDTFGSGKATWLALMSDLAPFNVTMRYGQTLAAGQPSGVDRRQAGSSGSGTPPHSSSADKCNAAGTTHDGITMTDIVLKTSSGQQSRRHDSSRGGNVPFIEARYRGQRTCPQRPDRTASLDHRDALAGYRTDERPFLSSQL